MYWILSILSCVLIDNDLLWAISIELLLYLHVYFYFRLDSMRQTVCVCVRCGVWTVELCALDFNFNAYLDFILFMHRTCNVATFFFFFFWCKHTEWEMQTNNHAFCIGLLFYLLAHFRFFIELKATQTTLLRVVFRRSNQILVQAHAQQASTQISFDHII